METWDDGAQRLTAQTWRSARGWSFSSKCGFDRLALLVHRGAVYSVTEIERKTKCETKFQRAACSLFITTNVDPCIHVDAIPACDGQTVRQKDVEIT